MMFFFSTSFTIKGNFHFKNLGGSIEWTHTIKTFIWTVSLTKGIIFNCITDIKASRLHSSHDRMVGIRAKCLWRKPSSHAKLSGVSHNPMLNKLSVKKKSGLHTFCCTSLCDWSRKFAPFSQPIKCKTRTNGVSAIRVFRAVFSSIWVLEGSGNFFLNLLWFAAVISLLLILRHLIEKRSKVKELLGIRWSQIWLQLEVSRISLF